MFMYHKYYEISKKGLENNNNIEIEINFKVDKDYIRNNFSSIHKLLINLEKFSNCELHKKLENYLSKNNDSNFQFIFNITSSNFIEKKKQIENLCEKYLDILEFSYNHDITGLHENEIVNLTYLRNISLNFGWSVSFDFTFYSISKETLIENLQEGLYLICEEFFENPEDITKEIIEDFNLDKISFEDELFSANICFFPDEPLSNFLQIIDYYYELISNLQTINGKRNPFSYSVTLSNSKHKNILFIY